MEKVDISSKAKNLIRFGLIILLAISGVIGWAAFNHWHSGEEIRLDAKITGKMVSERTLVNGKLVEVYYNDGDEVKAGDVIARLEVSVTEGEIKQLEETVELAKRNYETLKLGQLVKVPVRKPKVTLPAQTKGPTTLAALEERAKRMAELYEMGAVSAAQRDAAQKAYETARAESLAAPAAPNVSEEIEYVEQFQPTPPAVLASAESAIKQAELSLNVALQKSHENLITAPVSGTIYYTAHVDDELEAGNTVAKVGDNRELWLAAEVTEEVFDKIPLGKLINYTIDGQNFSGTVIEKISPDVVEVEEVVTEEISAEGTDDVKITVDENSTPSNDKYILRISLPSGENFHFKPGLVVSVSG